MSPNRFWKFAALAAFMGVGIAGCGDDPVQPVVVGAASNLMANSMDSASVGLRWTASSSSGVTYLVSYRKVGSTLAADSASMSATGNSAVVTGLDSGRYTFNVRAVSGSTQSAPVSLDWAPASRFTQDRALPTVSLRMYEFASSSGSGLILRPELGGPRNASVAAGSPDAPGSVALAIYTESATSTTFSIGPAYAFVDFRNADKFDSSSYISSSGYPVDSLNELYLNKPLSDYIKAGPGAQGTDTAGNIRAFELPASSSKGMAFLMRVGNGSNMHYARVFVRSVGGKLLQGTTPNRYVEIDLSYQTAAGVPFAKGVVRPDTRSAYTSRLMFPLQ